jgi:hypothetical protein
MLVQPQPAHLTAAIYQIASGGRMPDILPPVQFREHSIGRPPGTFQCAVGDINSDGKPTAGSGAVEDAYCLLATGIEMLMGALSEKKGETRAERNAGLSYTAGRGAFDAI